MDGFGGSRQEVAAERIRSHYDEHVAGLVIQAVYFSAALGHRLAGYHAGSVRVSGWSLRPQIPAS